MERYRLKNIIILILVLVNGFLLVSLAMRGASSRSARATAEEQLVALLAADGVTLDPDIISYETPPESLSVARDQELERRAASTLLGSPLTSSDQGGGITTYTGGRGVAMFRASGEFEASGTLAAEDAVEVCRSFCRAFGYAEPEFRLDSAGTGSGSAVCLRDGMRVFNCTLRFTLSEGSLTAVSGTLLSERMELLAEEQEPLSAIAALTAFQRVRRESAAVVSSITEMELCYMLQNSATAAVILQPCWRIATNTGEYYVNCSTGAVTAP